MRYLKTFEFFDFDKYFDIDEDVLSFVFADLLERYPFIGINLVEVDKDNFKVELYDTEPGPTDNLDEEYDFLKKKEIYTQVEAHFDVMDFKIKNCTYNKEENKIVLTIHQLIKESNKPRKGMKSRWSVKYKRSIDCNNPKGFSQKAYCARKRRGGKYKD
jgi:hypothetical protein